ncbi:hypothetical protein A3Q56_06113 [Intoshia linei]|uniref:SAM domain-containing protein n=1 Tax=Intoshia linei TaxID=1819745 RepID=A0A177AVX3_9BILA|nr:hypothetical protein A3Q56_06113 [Intoshia linei]
MEFVKIDPKNDDDEKMKLSTENESQENIVKFDVTLPKDDLDPLHGTASTVSQLSTINKVFGVGINKINNKTENGTKSDTIINNTVKNLEYEVPNNETRVELNETEPGVIDCPRNRKLMDLLFSQMEKPPINEPKNVAETSTSDPPVTSYFSHFSNKMTSHAENLDQIRPDTVDKPKVKRRRGRVTKRNHFDSGAFSKGRKVYRSIMPKTSLNDSISATDNSSPITPMESVDKNQASIPLISNLSNYQNQLNAVNNVMFNQGVNAMYQGVNPNVVMNNLSYPCLPIFQQYNQHLNQNLNNLPYTFLPQMYNPMCYNVNQASLNQPNFFSGVPIPNLQSNFNYMNPACSFDSNTQNFNSNIYLAESFNSTINTPIDNASSKGISNVNMAAVNVVNSTAVSDVPFSFDGINQNNPLPSQSNQNFTAIQPNVQTNDFKFEHILPKKNILTVSPNKIITDEQNIKEKDHEINMSKKFKYKMNFSNTSDKLNSFTDANETNDSTLNKSSDNEFKRQAIVKPRVIRHVIDGFVIEESSFPFSMDDTTFDVDTIGKFSELLNIKCKSIDKILPIKKSPKLKDVNIKKLKKPAKPKKPPINWTINNVCDFVKNLSGCSQYVDKFLEEEIDGNSLLLLTQDHLVNGMNIKLGPALKIIKSIGILKKSI